MAATKQTRQAGNNIYNDTVERRGRSAAAIVFLSVLCLCFAGCGPMAGYSDQPLFPSEVGTIYVEMFENQSYWRAVESEVSDALAKRIETQTPYKIVSSRDRADSVISGQIVSVSQSLLSVERQLGVALEKEVRLEASVTWKNLKTGQMLLENRPVSASASYSELQEQSFTYGSRLAANNLAQRIVELMETQW